MARTEHKKKISRSIVRGFIALGLISVAVIAGVLFNQSLLSYFSPKADTIEKPASLHVSPASGTYEVGKEFDVDFKVNTGGKSVIAVGVDVTYSDLLEFVKYSDSGSEFSSAASNPNPSETNFSFDRLRPDKVKGGYNGASGQVLKVTFKAKREGTAIVSINQDKSLVAEESQQDQSILGSVSNATFAFSNPPAAGGNTEPQPEPEPEPTVQPEKKKPAPTPKKVTPKPAPVKKEDPKPTAVAEPVKTVEKPTPSANLSTILSDGKCHTVATKAQLAIAIGDSTAKLLTDDEYKPVITVSPSKDVTSTVQKATNGIWRVDIESSTANTITTTITSKGVALATRDILFKDSCVATSDLPKPVATPEAPKPPRSNLPYIIGGAIALIGIIGSLIYAFIRKRKHSVNPVA